MKAAPLFFAALVPAAIALSAEPEERGPAEPGPATTTETAPAGTDGPGERFSPPKPDKVAAKTTGDDLVRLAWTDLSGLRGVLLRGADPNARTRSGDYPIVRVAYGGNVEALEILLDFNARTDVVNVPDYSTPAGALKALAAAIADSENSNLKNFTPATAVIQASSQVTALTKIRMLQLLLEYGYPADFRDGWGRTALMTCVLRDQRELAKLLVAYGANGEANDLSNGKTARDYASDAEMFRILRERRIYSPTRNPTYGKIRVPLFKAKKYPLLAPADATPRTVQATKESPLHLAVKNGDVEAVRMLLAAKISAITYDSERQTPLHRLCEARGIPTEAFRRIVALLELESGSKIFSLRDDRGRIPFHALCENGRADLVEILAQRDPKQISAADSEQNTPLHFAARLGEDGIPVASFLVSQGASVRKKNKNDETPLDIAVRSADSALFLTLFRNVPVDPVSGVNPLVGEPLFRNAFMSMHPSSGQSRRNENLLEIMRQLIEADVNVNLADPVTKENALHRAVAANCLSAVNYLLTTDIDVNKKDANGESPLDVAFRKNLHSVSAILEAHGAKSPKADAEKKRADREQQAQMTPRERRNARIEKKQNEH